jgi:hypothetical protein
VGVGIQISSVWVQIALQIENQVASLALDALWHPEKFNIGLTAGWGQRFVAEILLPVQKEFIESRPWAFRELALYAYEQTKNDPTFLAKKAASLTQMMIPFLAHQYLTLGVAVFWPMGLLLFTYKCWPSKPRGSAACCSKRSAQAGSRKETGTERIAFPSHFRCKNVS